MIFARVPDLAGGRGPGVPLSRRDLKGMPLRQALAPLLPLILTMAACGDPGGGVVTDMPGGAVAAQVAPGSVLPYGEIATVCDLPAAALGTRIGSAAGFTLYDSAADSIALRTHYITGMADGCARQFSAALALVGDLVTHEALRYQPANADLPYSATDLAYEQIKGTFCGVARGQPCGARIDRLARELAFVTVYETFGTYPEWNEFLLHDGDLRAISFRSS